MGNPGQKLNRREGQVGLGLLGAVVTVWGVTQWTGAIMGNMSFIFTLPAGGYLLSSMGFTLLLLSCLSSASNKILTKSGILVGVIGICLAMGAKWAAKDGGRFDLGHDGFVRTGARGFVLFAENYPQDGIFVPAGSNGTPVLFDKHLTGGTIRRGEMSYLIGGVIEKGGVFLPGKEVEGVSWTYFGGGGGDIPVFSTLRPEGWLNTIR